MERWLSCSICCSWRGPGFRSQQPHQLTTTCIQRPSQRTQCPLLGTKGTWTHTYTHIHITQKKNKKLKKKELGYRGKRSEFIYNQVAYHLCLRHLLKKKKDNTYQRSENGRIHTLMGYLWARNNCWAISIQEDTSNTIVKGIVMWVFFLFVFFFWGRISCNSG